MPRAIDFYWVLVGCCSGSQWTRNWRQGRDEDWHLGGGDLRAAEEQSCRRREKILCLEVGRQFTRHRIDLP